MAKKRVLAVVKLQCNAGAATPAPPVGTALGPHQVNIMEFCRQYNEATSSQAGTVVPVEITIFEDRSFTFQLKTPPAAVLLRQAARAPKGAAIPHKETVGTISRDQLREIATLKMVDLNANDVEAAERIIEGTARSMGIKVS